MALACVASKIMVPRAWAYQSGCWVVRGAWWRGGCAKVNLRRAAHMAVSSPSSHLSDHRATITRAIMRAVRWLLLRMRHP